MLDHDVNDGHKSTTVRTPAPCPKCSDASWSYGAHEGRLVCECGHLQPLIPVTQIVPQGVSA